MQIMALIIELSRKATLKCCKVLLEIYINVIDSPAVFYIRTSYHKNVVNVKKSLRF